MMLEIFSIACEVWKERRGGGDGRERERDRERERERKDKRIEKLEKIEDETADLILSYYPTTQFPS